jgi:Domain of unknown function (DUF4159)
MTRRDLLRRILVATPGLLLSSRALAFGDTSKLVFGQVRHGGHWDPRPHCLRRLAFEIMDRTSIEAVPQAHPLDADDPQIFRYPFLYLASEGALPVFSERQVTTLRRHLTYGGFLLADAADGSEAFDRTLRHELARVLPDSPLQRIPQSHVLYKSFYLIDHAGGRQIVAPYLEGATIQGRLAVVYSRNDLGGAWARDDRGDWEYEVVPGGENQRETAFRLGVNLAMYAMCLDYKDDQVHLPFILKRRR